eukprot:1481208-Amphidinium_carterae.1
MATQITTDVPIPVPQTPDPPCCDSLTRPAAETNTQPQPHMDLPSNTPQIEFSHDTATRGVRIGEQRQM